MTGLPEAVEQDRDVYDLLTPDGRGQAYKREALARLLAKVGAARERQGIERAAAVVCKYCAAKQPVVFSNKLDQWIHEPLGRGVFNPEGFVWDYCKAAAARALPVDGATP